MAQTTSHGGLVRSGSILGIVRTQIRAPTKPNADDKSTYPTCFSLSVATLQVLANEPGVLPMNPALANEPGKTRIKKSRDTVPLKAVFLFG